jgi:hypothetical protein
MGRTLKGGGICSPDSLISAVWLQADQMLDESRIRYEAQGKLQGLPPEPREMSGRGGRGGSGRGGVPFPIPKPQERIVDELR